MHQDIRMEKLKLIELKIVEKLSQKIINTQKKH